LRIFVNAASDIFVNEDDEGGRESMNYDKRMSYMLNDQMQRKE
jgi:hypothetical protein